MAKKTGRGGSFTTIAEYLNVKTGHAYAFRSDGAILVRCTPTSTWHHYGKMREHTLANVAADPNYVPLERGAQQAWYASRRGPTDY